MSSRRLVGGGTMTYVPPSLLLAGSPDAAGDAVSSYADARIEQFREEQGLESVEARRTREEEEDRKNFLITVGHAVFASVTIIASLFSMRWAYWGITKAAAGIPIGAAPYTVRQRRKLNRAESLREVMNQFRLLINKLSFQNDRLTEQNDKLRNQVDKLKVVEERLSNVVTRQGGDVDKFVFAVKENAAVQARMKTYLKAAAMQDAVSAVLKSDRNRDNVFGDDEIDMLVHRMLSHPDLRHKDEDEIRARLTSGWDRKIGTVLKKANAIYEEAGVGRIK